MKRLELRDGRVTAGADIIAKEAGEYCGALITTTDPEAHPVSNIADQVYDY